MKKKLSVRCSMALFTILSANSYGENLLKNGDAENGNENWVNTEVHSTNPHSGKNCFKMTSQSISTSKELIPIDNIEQYKIRGCFKSEGLSTQRLLLGFVPYDENKKQIFCAQVNVVQSTETELLEECSAEDMVIKVKDGSKWLTDAESPKFIAFEVDTSGEYKDLPNSNLSSRGISAVDKKETFWEITLSKPCGRTFPAGTKIREHSEGNAYVYPLIASNITPDWTEYSGIIKSKAKSGAATTQWWPGTKFVTVLVLTAGGKVIFDDITLEKFNK